MRWIGFRQTAPESLEELTHEVRKVGWRPICPHCDAPLAVASTRFNTRTGILTINAECTQCGKANFQRLDRNG